MKNERDNELWQAYQATSYEADTPMGKVSIRIGKLSPNVDRLLQANELSSWAFITASDPGSQKLSSSKNAQRHQQLLQDIANFGLLAFEGAGVPYDPNWDPETSLLILGIERDVAIATGIKSCQNAIVVGVLGEAAELVSCK